MNTKRAAAAINCLLFLSCTSSAQAVILPNDFSGTQGTNGIFYEKIGDNRLTNTLNPSLEGISSLDFLGVFSYGYPGEVAHPTYAYQGGQFFPAVQSDAADDVLILLPGTSGFTFGMGTANLGSSIRIQVATTGLYSVSGGFARDNVNFGWGDGVDVLVVKGSNLDSPLFSAHISQSHVVDTAHPFAGTGTVGFNLTVPLLAGDSLRFIVFSDSQGQDGTFDQTAFRTTLGQVPEPSSIMLAALGFGGLVAWGWRRRLRSLR